ncbi:hypothetical protein [Microbacterium sp. P04]|uniref:hypothetical protein n=1 Tax=Microbacterium sp. P04 TaxID=3366947 RepID=UPI003744D601
MAVKEAENLELVQSQNTAVVINRSRGVVAVLDSATLGLGEEIELPSKRAQMVLIPAGAHESGVMDAAVLTPSEGQVWREPITQLAKIAEHSAPEFEFGAGAGMAVGPEGELYVASPRDGAVYLLDDDGAQRRGTFPPFRASGSRQVELSVGVAGWAVLDPVARQVFTSAGSTVDLTGHGSELALEVQMPGSGIGEKELPNAVDALVATADGLLEISEAEVQQTSAGGEGEPARPVHIGDCVYGVWDSEVDVSGCNTGRQEGAQRVASELPTSDSSRPVLRTDGLAIVANDPTTGETWTVGPEGTLPMTWDSTPLAEVTTSDDTPRNDDRTPLQPTPVPDPTGPPHREVQRDKIGPPPGATQPADPPVAGDSSLSLLPGHVEVRTDSGAGTVELSWDPFLDPRNSGSADGYLVQRLTSNDARGACLLENGSPEITTGDVQSADSTSTIFGGAAPPEGGYQFVVWGFTDDECVSSEPVKVEAMPVPGAVADVHGTMTWTGTLYDWRIAPGDAPRYEVQRLDRSGSPVGDVSVLAGVGYPRELTGGSFGDTVDVRVRACAVWGADAACGPWSQHTAPEPSLDFTLADLAYSEERSEWTWTSLPDNGDVRLRIAGIDKAGQAQWEADSNYCRADLPVPRSDATLTIRYGDVRLEIKASSL